MSSRMDSSPYPSNRKTQYTIVTKNVSYGVSLMKCSFYLDKRILRNVNCEVKPGEITALAGPSGAGKTTLLEILAGFIPPCRVSGQVVVNDRPINAASFRSVGICHPRRYTVSTF
nr:ABC transporter G family member 10-like [Tanacetum cinerariifolium]